MTTSHVHLAARRAARKSRDLARRRLRARTGCAREHFERQVGQAQAGVKPHRPYAPALVAAGLDLARLLVVRSNDAREQLWAYEQALRAPECGAAFAWLGTHDERVLRRLAVAAREGRTWGVLWRRPGQRASAIAAPLRLALAPRDGKLAVQIVKRRGGDVAQPILLDMTARALPYAPTRMLPDARTSQGRALARELPARSALPQRRRAAN